MGLDTSHNCFHGSYGGFGDWRNHVAAAAEYGVMQTDGRYTVPRVDYSQFERRNYEGIWDTAPSDMLLVLFVHSDCDGVIKAEHCGPLADRLESLLPRMGEHYYAEITQQFITGLRAAAAAGEDVDFH